MPPKGRRAATSNRVLDAFKARQVAEQKMEIFRKAKRAGELNAEERSVLEVFSALVDGDELSSNTDDTKLPNHASRLQALAE